MIDPRIVIEVDEILDANVGDIYKQQPLAQDWARVAKVIEEAGEAIAELILYTGQNPRKGEHRERYYELLQELADAALTPIYAIQHFTKDIEITYAILDASANKHVERLRNADTQ